MARGAAAGEAAAGGIEDAGVCKATPLSLNVIIGGSAQQGADATGAQKRNFQPYHSKSVPKSEKLVDGEGAKLVTTMMLRNIPNKYTQNTLLQEIDEMGFIGCYDFFYLPMDVQNRSNVGYAFINFTTPGAADRFHGIFKEHAFRKHQSRKISSVCAAHVQGLDANLKHFETKAVTHSRNDQYRPVVLRDNERISFEDALAEVKAKSDGGEALRQNPACGSPSGRQNKDLESAVCEYLASRQPPQQQQRPISLEMPSQPLFDSTCGAGGMFFPPGLPPGFDGYMPSQGGTAWGRQSSAPASFHGSSPGITGRPYGYSGASASTLSSTPRGLQPPEDVPYSCANMPSVAMFVPNHGANFSPNRTRSSSWSVASASSLNAPAVDAPAYVPLPSKLSSKLPTIHSSSKLFQDYLDQVEQLEGVDQAHIVQVPKCEL